MKIRWTKNSVRLRISPTEFKVLLDGEIISEKFGLPSGSWEVEIRPAFDESSLRFNAGRLCFHLGAQDRKKLAEPDAEGVYCRSAGAPSILYFIEKDFPCAHPRAADALEPAHETFAPTPAFENRKKACPA